MPAARRSQVPMWALVALSPGFPAAVLAGETQTATGGAETAKAPSPWRGSVLTYEHVASVLSLDRSADLTYNPYYEHRLALQPEYHFGEHLYARARLELGQELTNADETRKKHEVVLDDLTLTAGVTGLMLPWGELVVDGSLQLTLPLSKASQAQSLVLAIGPGVGLSRHFDVLEGLDLGFAARLSFYLQRYTTTQLDSPWIPCSQVASDACGRYIHTGDRNAASQLSLGPTVDLAITEQLSASLYFQLRRSALYSVSDATVGAATGPVSTTDAAADVAARYSEVFGLEVSYALSDELSVALGSFNSYPQLADDGSYRTPLFNRYTEVYLDLTVHFDALAERI